MNNINNSISFVQLFGKHVFDVSLPEDNVNGYCRECGGPIQAETGFSKDHYTNSWIDEGLIPYSESEKTCPACFFAKTGSISRATLKPPYGKIVLVTPDKIWPSPDRLNLCFKTSKEAKNQISKLTNVPVKDVKILEYIHEKGLTLLSFLKMLPNISLPFGLIIGKKGNQEKHFLRVTPLNYDLNGKIVGLLLSEHRYIIFRWKTLLTLTEEFKQLYESREKELKCKKTKTKLNELKNQIAEELSEDLSETEQELFSMCINSM